MKGIACVLPLLLFIGTTYGFSRFKREIPNGYGVNHPCPGKGHWDAVGHMNGGYTPQKNVFGQDFKGARTVWTVDLCKKDSDGDGLTNGEELGDPQCKWRPGDRPPGPVKGHPGFCEPDRPKCDSGMTHRDCPNPRARRGRGRGRGSSRTPQRRLPPGANDHPQTFLTKNLDQGGMRQGPPGFDMRGGAGMFPPSSGFRPSASDRFGDSGGFDSSFSGTTRGPAFGYPPPSSQSFRPPMRPGLSSFSGGFRGESFGAPGMSRDFGVSGGSGPGFSSGGSDFSVPQYPGVDRFSSSLDQRAIQGMGSPASGPSFTSSLSQFDIDRSVRARMDRERSRGVGFSGMDSRGMGTAGMGPMDYRGRGSFAEGPAGMGTMTGEGMGGGMGSDTMGSFSAGGMESSYPPFRSFSGEGRSMPGPGFSGGMSMSGPPGMPRRVGGMMSRRPFTGF